PLVREEAGGDRQQAARNRALGRSGGEQRGVGRGRLLPSTAAGTHGHGTAFLSGRNGPPGPSGWFSPAEGHDHTIDRSGGRGRPRKVTPITLHRGKPPGPVGFVPAGPGCYYLVRDTFPLTSRR